MKARKERINLLINTKTILADEKRKNYCEGY